MSAVDAVVVAGLELDCTDCEAGAADALLVAVDVPFPAAEFPEGEFVLDVECAVAAAELSLPAALVLWAFLVVVVGVISVVVGAG
jgi:hypothetical protein